MTYARWKESWRGEPEYGYGPEKVAAERGDSITGLTYFLPDPKEWIIGEVNDNIDVSAYVEWQLEKISAEEVLVIWQRNNPQCFIDDNGRVITPIS
jgi:hypothetical protein